MSECLFCGIANGTVPAERVAEGDGWVAVRDIHPQAPVHLLILSTEHIENLNGLESGSVELAGRLLLAAREVARRQGLAESGYRVVTNVNRDGGQTVPHLHLHVLGGRPMGWPPG
ncbi:MAG: histidine triad nucleotide-binding protein [Gemmatimonadota bacterium]